ncbi:MAG: RNA 2',3'-cyclic phosphodiesterase [Planctomycetes bacterium]|nr:RNA 2',3'-cyclic phosphodiesterase [Planctomycetota bacterium]
MARTFVALALPAKLRQRLSEEADRLRLAGAAVSWTRPENYHVTIRFLGELPDEDLLVLDALLRGAAVACQPLPLTACGLGTFPDTGSDSPRVVWCGISEQDPSRGDLQGLRNGVQEALRGQGCRAEKGAFDPHITLGRVRSPLNAASLLERMGPAVRRAFGTFVARDLILYETVRTKQGVAYEPLQRFPLGG